MESELSELRLQVDELKALLNETKSKPKARKKDTIKYWSEEQTAAFFSVIKSSRDMALFRLMYHRGLRASELGPIRLEDWNVRQDRIRFGRLKGSNDGEYHLTSHEARALKAWAKVRGTEAGPLFPSRQARNSGISRRMIDVLVKRYGQLAGLPAEL